MSNLYLKQEGAGVFRLCMHAPPAGKREGFGIEWKGAESLDRETAREMIANAIAAVGGVACGVRVDRII